MMYLAATALVGVVFSVMVWLYFTREEREG